MPNINALRADAALALCIPIHTHDAVVLDESIEIVIVRARDDLDKVLWTVLHDYVGEPVVVVDAFFNNRVGNPTNGPLAYCDVQDDVIAWTVPHINEDEFHQRLKVIQNSYNFRELTGCNNPMWEIELDTIIRLHTGMEILTEAWIAGG